MNRRCNYLLEVVVINTWENNMSDVSNTSGYITINLQSSSKLVCMTETLPIPEENKLGDKKAEKLSRDREKKERSDKRASSEGKPRTDNPHHPSGHAHKKGLREADDRERNY